MTLADLPGPARGGLAPLLSSGPQPRRPDGIAAGGRLLPRPDRQRPERRTLVHRMPPAALAQQREAMNRALTARSTDTPQVVLYVPARPGGCPDGDLAECQGYAAIHGLLVTERIVDRVDDHGTADDPSLRRGYARALRQVSDPDSNITGLVSVSRTAISPDDLLYRDQLTRIASLHGGLWLVRRETDI